MLALYSRFTNSDDQWQKYYNEILLWKNKNVEIEDGLIKHSGKLLGIKMTDQSRYPQKMECCHLIAAVLHGPQKSLA